MASEGMLILFNPLAGRRRAGRLRQVLDMLAARRIRFELAETRCAGHAVALARAAADRAVAMVVAAGGDGTIAEVANGLADSATPLGAIPLGIIPLGTANVLAHELALPFAPGAIVAALAAGRTRPLWPGLVCRPEGTRLFMQMLGVGLDAQVVHTLPAALKRLFGSSAYALHTTRTVFRYRYPPIRLRIDDLETSATSAIVSKGVLYGGRYRLALDAVPGEPGFSLALFDHAGPGRALLHGAALPANLLARAPWVRRFRARRIEFLVGAVPLPVQADGDRAGFTPLVVRDAAGPLRVVTP